MRNVVALARLFFHDFPRLEHLILLFLITLRSQRGHHKLVRGSGTIVIILSVHYFRWAERFLFRTSLRLLLLLLIIRLLNNWLFIFTKRLLIIVIVILRRVLFYKNKFWTLVYLLTAVFVIIHTDFDHLNAYLLGCLIDYLLFFL